MPHKQEKHNHEPVLIDTVEKYTGLKKGDTAIDCTLGLAGHSEMFLKQIGAKGKLIVFEQDEMNLKRAKERLKEKKDQIIFIHTNFVHLQSEIERRNISGIRLIFFDLGLSSPQVEDPERGFSFQLEGPLDMRFDRRNTKTAEQVISSYSEKRLMEIFKEYGEERYAKKYARVIKNNLPIKTTTELARLIEKNAPRQRNRRGKKIHPATRIFQALRIEVNNELEILKNSLKQALSVLEPGGRLMAISYHSLEDRIVKRFMKRAAKECICPPELPVCECNHRPEITIETKKPLTPDEEETERNPRARSAKLRVGIKTDN